MIAKTFFGLEEVLMQELLQLGAKNVEKQNRAVSFEGDKELLYRSNLQLRTALRILIPFKSEIVKNEKQLYNCIRKVDWSQYFSEKNSIYIDSVVTSEAFNHSKYVAQVTKDAIVDQFRKASGKRPRVERQRPDFVINVHIYQETITIAMDSSGESLHMRGYRQDTNDAPLNEVLAAGLVLNSQWKADKTFIDLTCGSATILIEAARFAFNIHPMKSRTYFGFKNWKDFDFKLYQEIISDIESKEVAKDVALIGMEISAQTAQIAKRNIRSAGLEGKIEIRPKAFQKMVAPEGKAIIISNPPYDERLQEADINNLYYDLGEKLFTDFKGSEAWFISSNLGALKSISLKTKKRVKLMNGPLEAFFYGYDIREEDEVS
ncbi:THUMP domain-containing protein [Cyclobacteriaceae bacterium]|nr:THUMP domain-containing protein [Cyclobacteriaceae bacterium]